MKKLGKIPVLFMSVLAAAGLAFLQGCGGSSGANVITVSVSVSPSSDVIVGTSITLTATVSGATTATATWQPCMFTTTTTDSTGKTTTSTPAACPNDPTHTPSDPNFTIFGSFTNQQTTTAPATETFTAANALPVQKTYPGLQIIVTAQSTQDTKKTGSVNLTLNSGIGLVLNQTTATVPTKEQQQFTVSLTNDLQSQGVTWLVMQPTSKVPIPTAPPFNSTTAPSCSAMGQATDCGSIDPKTGLYTAPSAIPVNSAVTTPADVTLIVYSNADNTRFAFGTITVIQGGPITFNGISPSIAPQGAAFWDLYLDAPNISSSSTIFLNYQDNSNPPKPVGKAKQFPSSSGQIKILFPIPTSSTANPTSTGARLRLLAQDLINPAGVASVLVTVGDPVEPVCPPTCPSGTTPPPPSAFTFSFVPVRPTTTATVPDDVLQGSSTQLTIDGGYFGPSGSFSQIYFQTGGPALTPNANTSSARQLNTSLSADKVTTGNPGLYPVFVSSSLAPPLLVPNPTPAASNIAVFPDYSPGKPQPQVVGPGCVSAPCPIPAGTNPSAIDIDATLGILAVAETGSNTVEFFSIGNGSLTSLGVVGNTAAAPINVPTGLSIDRNNHTVAVVNYGTLMKDKNGNPTIPSGQGVTVLPLPGNTTTTAFNVDLTNALQGSVSPPAMPYSIAVDPDSHLALVAYSSTSLLSFGNVGFVVNLNPNSGSNPYGCPLTNAITPPQSGTGPVGQCLFSQVTLNTGIYPKVAMSPHSHLALVTPGGGIGGVRGVDVTTPSSANLIASANLSAGLVTVTIDTTKCPPPLPNPTSTTNPCPFNMIPGNAGTVLITGVTPTKSASNASFFNGEFPVNVISTSSFTYTVTDLSASDTASGGTVFYGNPGFPPIAIASTLQGVAINPITNTAALANANSTGTNGPQIDLLSGLDQTVSSITFFADCSAFSTSCPSSPELLATTEVAWQPFTNEVVSYNPQQQQLSVSDPVSRKRYARIPPAPGLGLPPQPPLGPSAFPLCISNGTTNSLTLWGGVVVDPATNQAFVVESGKATGTSCPNTVANPGQIEIVDLNFSGSLNAPTLNVKSLHISDLIVPSPTPGVGVIGGIPNASVPQATLTSKNALSGVRIFGSGFVSGVQVRLDGTDIKSQGGTIDNIAPSGREIDVTIPPSFLALPHHFALDIFNTNSGVQSNVTDFYVIQQVPFSQICKDTNGNFINTQPTGVAIADELANGPFSPIAVVTNTGCGSISTIDINPSSPTFGTVLNTISVGKSPLGVALSQRFGLAVVANNGDNTASVVNLLTNKQAVPAVSTGIKPMGVAINEATGVALIADNGANEVTEINLAPLFASTPATSLMPASIGGLQQPIAVAIDPDRGTNNLGIAVVTGLQLQNGISPAGALYVVDLGGTTPVLASTNSFFSAIPTGVVFDPLVATGGNPGLFYANSTGTNVIASFNPDSGSSIPVSVGVNPTSLAINPQTGALLTSNSAGQSISLVDTLSSPLRTRQTLAIPGAAQFGVAIDQFTNLAVIVDQANQRVLLFPTPN